MPKNKKVKINTHKEKKQPYEPPKIEAVEEISEVNTICAPNFSPNKSC